jgi:hypothetical protein
MKLGSNCSSMEPLNAFLMTTVRKMLLGSAKPLQL